MVRLRHRLRSHLGVLPVENDIKEVIDHAMEQGWLIRDVFGLNPIMAAMQTALVAVEETSLRKDGVTAIMLNAGMVSDVDAAVDELVKALEKAGINDVIKANQEQLDAFLAGK